jgi:membrane-associated protease RseP (regulator of RpoE activity)
MSYDPSIAYPSSFPPKFQDMTWRQVVLLAATFVTTTLTGAGYYAEYLGDFGRNAVSLDFWHALTGGLWFSLPLLIILGAHEFGHYAYCRRYNIDATLPFFIPFIPYLSGTLGAVIRIREAFPTRRVLFDIGVAGPIAGFVVLLPCLFWGMAWSPVVHIPPLQGDVLYFGEPILFRLARFIVHGPLGVGQDINMHPMLAAAWFGMLATAINLLPFGQMDGGHLAYATLDRWSTPLSIATVTAAVVMVFFAISWLFMALIMVAMVFIFGPRHPRVIYEHETVGAPRYAIAIFAIVMLILCFTPVPLQHVFLGSGK